MLINTFFHIFSIPNVLDRFENFLYPSHGFFLLLSQPIKNSIDSYNSSFASDIMSFTRSSKSSMLMSITSVAMALINSSSTLPPFALLTLLLDVAARLSGS